ncbi:MAG: NUDIX hydrolase [Planctomycetota bacterium]|nr:MAG: NUDIX hydrolase [Planctomycetota bacterium]
MPTAPLLALLDDYLSRFPEEAPMVARVQTLLRAHPSCFERSCVPGHITGGAWISSPDAQHCVLLHHGKLDRWLQPGGHSDGDARTERVAQREAEEETGLKSLRRFDPDGALAIFDVDVHEIPAHGDEPAHEHHDIRFLFIADPDEPPVCSDESHALRWLPVAELTRFTNEESVLRLARKCEAVAASSRLSPGRPS